MLNLLDPGVFVFAAHRGLTSTVVGDEDDYRCVRLKPGEP